MQNYPVTIESGGGINPSSVHVNSGETVTITNQSGVEREITYPPAPYNPFSDVDDGSSEPLADGEQTTHTIAEGFDDYELVFSEGGEELEAVATSPTIRITGTEDD